MKIARMGLWEWDVKTNETKWGDEKFILFGYEPREFELTFENAFKTVYPDDKDYIFKTLEENLPISDYFDYEYRGIKKDGSIMDVWVRVNVERDEEGNPVTVYGISQDITNRKKMESEIRELNESLEAKVNERTAQLEKKVDENVLLIKEMHHRVKNNMQVISSMLNMQKQYIDDKMASDTLSQCIKRIKSMAIIHDSLYTSDNLTEIELSEYVNKLVEMNTEEEIDCTLSVPKMNLSISKMVPIGLIVNELISNSLKHAFKESNEPPRIELKIVGTPKFHINYSDNGNGFESNSDKERASFGMELIETLCEDLEADYSITSVIGEGMNFSMKLS